jgi:hypothetical protein
VKEHFQEESYFLLLRTFLLVGRSQKKFGIYQASKSTVCTCPPHEIHYWMSFIPSKGVWTTLQKSAIIL